MVVTNQSLEAIINESPEDQVLSLVRLKHAVIGHEEEKKKLLHNKSFPILLDLLKHTSESNVKLQISIILGSLAYGDSKAISLMMEHRTIYAILSVINLKENEELLTTSFRSLCSILNSDPDITVDVKGTSLISTLKSILSSPNTSPNLLYHASQLLASSKQFINKMDSLGEPLMERIGMMLLQYRPNMIPLVSLLFAFSQLITEDQALFLLSPFNPTRNQTSGSSSADIKAPHSNGSIRPGLFMKGLYGLLRATTPEIRLAAVVLLSKLSSFLTIISRKEQMVQPILPELVTMVNSFTTAESVDHRVYKALAVLCKDNPRLADLAAEAGLIKKIADTIKGLDYTHPINSQIVANGLLAEAFICLNNDSRCLLVVGSGVFDLVINIIVRAPVIETSKLSRSEVASIRRVTIGACYVLRSLSRSVQLLRTTLEKNDIVYGILGLLSLPDNQQDSEGQLESGSESENESENSSRQSESRDSATLGSNPWSNLNPETLDVKSAAMASLCNIILEFGTLQPLLVEEGVISLIVDGIKSSYSPLRLNSVWALKHLVYGFDSKTKDLVMEQLPSRLLIELCNDKDLGVQEQALAFIKNITVKSSNHIKYLFDQFGIDNFFAMLKSKLDYSTSMVQLDKVFSPIIANTVYILVNIASTSYTYRDIIIQQKDLLKKICELLKFENSELRIAISWFVTNLTWVENHDDRSIDACKVRADFLITCGFKEKLVDVSNDSVLDVRNRTKTALFQLETLTKHEDEEVL